MRQVPRAIALPALLLFALQSPLLAGADPPRWFSGTQLTRPAVNLLGEMRSAESRGLDSRDYRGNELAVAIAGLPPDATATQIARIDAAFSTSAARFVADLHAGRVSPRQAGHDLAVPHAQLDPDLALAALARSSDTAAVLDDWEPGLRHYTLLKRALARYRELALEPGLTDLPALPARSVKPGERYAGMPALRRLLRALGDLDDPVDRADATSAAVDASGESLLDPAAVAALQHFQRRHGIDADGALGRTTWAALTRPLATRVRQIELSLERARWLPPRLDSPPIIVNIPQYRLFAFHTTEDAEDAMLQMKVIVGRNYPGQHTPVFAADMRYIVFRPYWDVPASIMRSEFLARLRADPSWATRNGYEIVSGAGDDGKPVPPTAQSVESLARGSLRLRQRPGAANALGLAKFMFPNRHNVYLHGTPVQSLFAASQRAFSHGCIRVEDPLELATFVLRNDPAWSREAIAAALQGPAPVRVNLAQPIRVMILYATALATESGEVLFFEDIYGHDARLERQLGSRQRLPPIAADPRSEGSTSPGADAARIEVHEIGTPVVADAAARRRQRQVAQSRAGDVAQAHVDRPTLHVQAALRHAAAGSGEPLVRLRRAIPGNDLVAGFNAGSGGQIGQLVEQHGFDRMGLLRPMITQQPVDLVDRRRDIAGGGAIGHRELLAGVRVVQLEPAFDPGRTRRSARLRAGAKRPAGSDDAGARGTQDLSAVEQHESDGVRSLTRRQPGAPRSPSWRGDSGQPQAQYSTGITFPVSPGRALTETTVARGKKLNSDALAQV
ncbi:MAG: L,D-transpeptidase family protein [Steroidobacteraceae bacterium]